MSAPPARHGRGGRGHFRGAGGRDSRGAGGHGRGGGRGRGGHSRGRGGSHGGHHVPPLDPSMDPDLAPRPPPPGYFQLSFIENPWQDLEKKLGIEPHKPVITKAPTQKSESQAAQSAPISAKEETAVSDKATAEHT